MNKTKNIIYKYIHVTARMHAAIDTGFEYTESMAPGILIGYWYRNPCQCSHTHPSTWLLL